MSHFFNPFGNLFCRSVAELFGRKRNIGTARYPGSKEFFKPRNIPVIVDFLVSEIDLCVGINGIVNHIDYGILNILAVKHLISLLVDKFSLLVHNIVILQYALTGGKVHTLFTLLGAFYRAGQHCCFKRLVFVNL